MNLLEGFPIIVECPVVWGEMDAMRHVNNVVYFRYFETARIAYFRKLDWHDPDQNNGVGPILASTECRFRKPLTYPDKVSIGARVSSIAEDRFVMDYLVVSERLAAVAAEGRGTIVIYHYGEAKKVPMPEELRRRISELERRG